MSQAKKLLAAFAGAKNAHGTTTVGAVGRDGKADSTSKIIREPLTAGLVQKHIDGKQGIGAIPINEDNNCKFGAIDIDVYDLDQKALQNKIQLLKLPLLQCRSKSGGAHLYLFLKEWEKASVVREYLTEMSIMLGHSGSEIFPKQDSIIVERGDVGNFINMPYFNAEEPHRFCYDKNTESLELNEFLKEIAQNKVSLSDLEDLREVKKVRQHFKDGPPCIRNIFESGPQGTPRNKLLFFLGVYAKKKHPDGWREVLEEYNRTLMSPPLPSPEVASTIKQHEKKDYAYTCKDEPFKSFCDPALCVVAEFGIGGDVPDAPKVGGLTILLSEPRLYFMDVNGHRIQLSTEQLQNQTLWQRQCMEQCNFMPPTGKADKWQQMVNGLMNDATQIDVPEELTITGQFKDHLRSYCTSYIKAMSPEEIEMGKPWTEDGKTKFKLDGLIEYLNNYNFKGLNRGQISQLIKNMGGDSGHQSITKKDGARSTLRCWWVPEFEKQEVKLPVKEVSNDIPF